ncbi:hypothetical protein, partial [Lysinibacillus xylanilyticus]|uniref:hypothetical protein n=1 Tax=Lysinibacillus xylanilyticus TaxID=582475 RepID=UPI0036DE84B0
MNRLRGNHSVLSNDAILRSKQFRPFYNELIQTGILCMLKNHIVLNLNGNNHVVVEMGSIIGTTTQHSFTLEQPAFECRTFSVRCGNMVRTIDATQFSYINGLMCLQVSTTLSVADDFAEVTIMDLLTGNKVKVDLVVRTTLLLPNISYLSKEAQFFLRLEEV